LAQANGRALQSLSSAKGYSLVMTPMPDVKHNDLAW
jgi:hypothetical protein